MNTYLFQRALEPNSLIQRGRQSSSSSLVAVACLTVPATAAHRDTRAHTNIQKRETPPLPHVQLVPRLRPFKTQQRELVSGGSSRSALFGTPFYPHWKRRTLSLFSTVGRLPKTKPVTWWSSARDTEGIYSRFPNFTRSMQRHEGRVCVAIQRRGEESEGAFGSASPPANSNKPLTPFSIEDILNKPSVKKSVGASICPPRVLEKVTAPNAQRNGISTPSSPLCALEELASKTFKGLEVSVIQAAEGREHVNSFGQRQNSKKRRKSRTAFTNHQIYELEKRFLYQKYLSPADRDQIAQQLGLSNAQVITWFQNRRAKLKRDLEEMKADVESLKKLTPQTLQKLVTMESLDEQAQGGAGSPSVSPTSPQGHGAFPQSPASSRDHTTDEFSEDDEEIEVDD
ncbi:hypothetical protein WMY93_008897 [Mugilogobius chulae]|uniref:Homeobox domain-containing protein n=1 Tax=Mugilogobius chulae TaxID=88201 RepID=A0AAW0PKE2_9GOBI